MKNIRGKSLKEWKEDSDKDRHNIPMRTQKYIVCLEERIKQLLIQRVSKSVNCKHEHIRSAQCEVDYCIDCDTYIPS